MEAMMSFERNSALRWHQEIPGSRWFKADLHVHTIDDLPGGRVRMPAGVSGDATDPAVLQEYARVFLRGAVRAGIQVLGLTPHATKVGGGPETSAIWHIVDAWNGEDDADGVPFREKIYAVFPGFEPNVNDGRGGVHLLFLIDPEIGRERFLAAFDAVMDGRAPWNQGDVRLTTRSAKEIIETLNSLRQDVPEGRTPWDYLVLAPHFQNHHGVLREVQRQVLETFPCGLLAGYELGDQKLPGDFDESSKPGQFLFPFMREHRQWFFHGSDAYAVPEGDQPAEGEVGYRFTWVKLASPRIEALRQAFLASESRLRIAYQRDANGSLVQLPEPPDPLAGTRPWLRQVKIKGEAAFFGGSGSHGAREVAFDLSPDLTCVIGGSMTGKSTLLDGLRIYTGADLPADPRLLKDVQDRGRERFLAGQPEVQFDTPGRRAGALHERWEAVFFTQNELQRLAEQKEAIEDILARLVPGERNDILARREALGRNDGILMGLAQEIEGLLDQRADAEQQLAAARDAKVALEAFEQAGLARMQSTERLHAAVERVKGQARDVLEHAAAVKDGLSGLVLDEQTEGGAYRCLQELSEALPQKPLGALHSEAARSVVDAGVSISAWADELQRLDEILGRAVGVARRGVEKKLAEMGLGAEKLAEFKTLSRRAGLLGSLEAAHAEVEGKLNTARDRFQRIRDEREALVQEQREAFGRVKAIVERQFADRIRIRRIDFGVSDELGRFFHSFGQKGITRWWNSLAEDQRPSPEMVFDTLRQGHLSALGVSDTVEERFHEVFTEAKRHELRALRSPDRYVLELQVGDAEYRDLSRLSGGRRVSLVLSLLLEAHDERPLVIDQPEDELDNRFLWETVLPALRRLKGRRQVVVATHNANLVVNGDADLVIQLEADAEHGRVAVSGAIEDPAVRRAIVETVDGGEKAFELRKAKYGF